MNFGNRIIDEPFRIALGTALLPAYSFGGDPNTGIWSPGGDILAMSLAGSEIWRASISGTQSVVMTYNGVDGCFMRLQIIGGGHPVYDLWYARAGTTPPQQNDELGALSARGQGATGPTTSATGAIKFMADETWTDTQWGTYIDIALCKIATDDLVNVGRFSSAGHFWVYNQLSVGRQLDPGSSSYLIDVGSNTYASNVFVNINAAAGVQVGYYYSKAGVAQWASYVPANSTALAFWDSTADRVIFPNGGGIIAQSFDCRDTASTTAVSAGNIIATKVTKAYNSDLFNAAGLTDSVVVWTQPADTVLLGCKMVLTTQFAAPAITDIDVIIGDAGDNDGLTVQAMNLISDAAATAYKDRGAYWNGVNAAGYYTNAAKEWTAYATAADAFLNTLTAGQLDFYFYYIQL